MARPIMDFKKGDHQTHYFQIETVAYVPGSLVWFIAKPSIDNDGGDSAAAINKSFDDSTIVGLLDDDNAMYLDGFVTYRLDFIPADIVNVSFEGGEDSKEYLGEFEVVDGVGIRQSFPSNNEYIQVIIYADVKRGGA